MTTRKSEKQSAFRQFIFLYLKLHKRRLRLRLSDLPNKLSEQPANQARFETNMRHPSAA